MIDNSILKYFDLFQLLIKSKDRIGLSNDYWNNDSHLHAYFNLAFSACHSLLVIATSLLAIANHLAKPEDQ